MTAVLVMHPQLLRTTMGVSARNAIRRIIGARMDLTTAVKMIVFPAIPVMLRATIMRVNARLATALVMVGLMPILTTQDLTTVYRVIQVTNQAITTPGSVPTVTLQETHGATPILTTAD